MFVRKYGIKKSLLTCVAVSRFKSDASYSGKILNEIKREVFPGWMDPNVTRIQPKQVLMLAEWVPELIESSA